MQKGQEDRIPADGGIRWNCCGVALQPSWASHFTRLGLRSVKVQWGDAGLQQKTDLLERLTICDAAWDVASCRSQVRRVRPRLGSGTRRLSSQACCAGVSNGVRRRKVSAWACCRAVATSRSSRVSPGRTIWSRRSLSQASWNNKVGLSCSRARSTNQPSALRNRGAARGESPDRPGPAGNGWCACGGGHHRP